MGLLLMTKAGALPFRCEYSVSQDGAHHFPFAPSHLFSGAFMEPGFFETYLTYYQM